mmetsp:Transcript_37247/g.89569  ORF Transcript_37247/g.89569 Transcript_37247/m.89569 type:complete len:81 (+) Transcript_37247:529-771(+)
MGHGTGQARPVEQVGPLAAGTAGHIWDLELAALRTATRDKLPVKGACRNRLGSVMNTLALQLAAASQAVCDAIFAAPSCA